MGLEIDNRGFSDALVILGAAGIVIPAFARLRISPGIGFILVGPPVGPAGLGSLPPTVPWRYFCTISNPNAIQPYAAFGTILLRRQGGEHVQSFSVRVGLGGCPHIKKK